MSSAAEFSIVPATLDDVDELVNLERSSFVANDGLLNQRSFRYHLKRGNLCLLARDKLANELAGYVLVLPHRRSARIYSLATAAQFQHRGVARALLRAAMAEIQRRQIGRVHLEVRRENTPALALYQALGFRIQRVRQNYYGDNQDAICMQWTAVE